MDKKDIIAMLNADFVRELEATMVYSQNSFLWKIATPAELPRPYLWMK